MNSTDATREKPGEKGEPAPCPIFDDPFRLFDEWSSAADGEAFDDRASFQ